jgi:hypothetical protein
MSAPEDDDDLMIADHGTVIMDRKPQFPVRPAPPNPPPPPSLAQPPAPPPQPPLSGPTPSGLPVLPTSITGLPPKASAPAAGPPQRLIAIVGGAAFAIVFFLGALIMLLVRLTQDAAEPEAPPAPSASAMPAPSAALPTVAPVPEPAATTEGAIDDSTTRVIAPPPPPRGTGSARSPAAGTKGTGKRRISDDL